MPPRRRGATSELRRAAQLAAGGAGRRRRCGGWRRCSRASTASYRRSPAQSTTPAWSTCRRASTRWTRRACSACSPSTYSVEVLLRARGAAPVHPTRQARRRIVNVSSAAAVGLPGQYVDYAAARGRDRHLHGRTGREVATEGVRVNAIRPGIIETDIHASGGLPERARQMAPMVPMQRAGSAGRSGAGDRLAAVGRGQLHHRRDPRRRAAGAERARGRNAARRT